MLCDEMSEKASDFKKFTIWGYMRKQEAYEYTVNYNTILLIFIRSKKSYV